MPLALLLGHFVLTRRKWEAEYSVHKTLILNRGSKRFIPAGLLVQRQYSDQEVTLPRVTAVPSYPEQLLHFVIELF